MSTAVVRLFQPTRRADARAATSSQGLSLGLVCFVLIHAALGPVFYEIRQLAVLHAFVVTGVAIWVSISRNRTLEEVATVGAYIVGAEVLWRMTRVAGPVLFYEFAKYELAALFFVALVARSRFGVRGQLPAIGYLALLLPSALIPLTELDFAVAREDLSFNLSGPLMVTMGALFFSQVDAERLDRRRFLLAIMGPVLSIAGITIAMLFRDDVVFAAAGSNKTISGNFGPNQVSAMLGLGALAALLCLLEDRTTKLFRAFLFALMVLMLVESALTFSRGGLYTFGGAAFVACCCLVQDRRKILRLAIVLVLFFAVADYIVLPRLDEFTDGTLTARFESTSLTGRDELIESELAIWKENPVFGVGPGQAMYHRDASVLFAGAHTEFSRLLAEHGLFGLGSLILLLVISVRAVKSGSAPTEKALALSALAWSYLFMASAAMRIVAPAFLVGLSAALQPAVDARQTNETGARHFRHRHQLSGDARP